MVHIVVADDEPVFIKSISDIVKNKMESLGISCIIHALDNAAGVIDLVDEYPVSLIFLDIDMPGMSGLDAAERLYKEKHNQGIVFVSGYDSYVFDALKVCPFDFIRKRKMKEEIPDTIERFIGIYRIDNKFITVKSCYKSLRILAREVLYIKKLGRNTSIIKEDGTTIKTWEPISYFEKEYESLGFIRIRKDTIVNIKYLVDVSEENVILNNGIELPSSKERYEEITRRFLAYRRK